MQIKFRGWHFKLKKMFSCEDMVRDQMTLLTDGRFINVSGADTRLSRVAEHDIMIPLQYTGVDDKNGVEIYVGDILKVKMGDTWQDNVEVVSDIGKLYAQMHEADCYMRIMEVIVIGNIYENPELLNNEG